MRRGVPLAGFDRGYPPIDKLTFAVVNSHEHVVDYTLTDLEARLDPRRFARVHRATIINIAFVQELFPAVDGGMLVRLKDAGQTGPDIS